MAALEILMTLDIWEDVGLHTLGIRRKLTARPRFVATVPLQGKNGYGDGYDDGYGYGYGDGDGDGYGYGYGDGHGYGYGDGHGDGLGDGYGDGLGDGYGDGDS